MPAPNDLIIELRDTFASSFSSDELTDFAFELGIDLEDVPGNTRKAKARELASYLSRHDLIDQLATVGPEARPDIAWAAILGRYGIVAPPVTVQLTGPVPFSDLQVLQPILAERPMFRTPDGRASTLSLAGVGNMVTVDLNGNSLLVAGLVLDQLNHYGEIAPGDTAIGRLLNYVRQDPALPPKKKQQVDDIIDRNKLLVSSD